MSPPQPQPPYVANAADSCARPPQRPAHEGLTITAFVLAVGTVLLSQLMYVAQLVAITRFGVNPSLATAYVAIASIVIASIAIAALVLGIVSVRGARPVLAGIAIGISGAHLVSQLLYLLTPAFLP